MSTSPFRIRIATPADIGGVSDLLTTSYGELLAGHYDPALLSRALPLIAKANPALVASGRYYVADANENRIIGCGGWSLERPGTGELESGLAHVRHFATQPGWVRRGVAKALLLRCIRDADVHGAEAMEAFSTLSAVDFYGALGFGVIEETKVELAPDLAFPSVLMRRPKIAM
jgi:N-acetylglutamate synthase-like GNAT family acetyltransferase